MTLAAGFGSDLLRAVLQGAPPGAVYALIALGFVLTYKTSGVFNLAFGAQAFVSASVYYSLHVDREWGVLPSLLVAVVLLAPLVGFALEWLVFRHLRTASAVAKLVVTIGLSVAVPSLVTLFVTHRSVSPPRGIVPDGSSVFYEVLGTYSFSRNELVTMAVAALAVLSLGALFRYSAIGLQMRAVVESPRMVALNGIAPDRVSGVAWALSSFFAGLAGVLIAPRFNTLASGDFFNLVVVGVAAAAVGRLVSLPRAMAGGLGLGVLIAVFTTFMPQWSETLTWLRPIQANVTPAIPFLVLFAVLVLDPALRSAREAADPLSGVDPPPSSLSSSVGGASRSAVPGRVAAAVVLLGLGAVVLTQADAVWTFRITQAVVLSIVFLSITVITGYAGQISLAQGAFAAIGAFGTFQMVDRFGMSSFVGALVAAVIAALAGALLALPLRRLGGIWVAIATLAFAYFFDSVMVKLSWVSGTSAASPRVPRPVIGPWDLSDDRALLVFSVIVLAVVATVVLHLRSGTIGQQLRALRGSEVAAQSIGISPVRVRMVAFAVSAGIAGLGGGLLAIQQQSVNYDNNFTPFGALFWLVLVVTAGAGLVSGAVASAAIFALFDAVVLQGTFLGWILRSPERIPDVFPIPGHWLYVGFGLAVITFARHPEGWIEMSRKQRAARQARRQERAAARTSAGAASEAGELVG